MPTVTDEQLALVRKAEQLKEKADRAEAEAERLKKALAKKDALTPARDIGGTVAALEGNAPAVSVGGYNRNSQGFSLCKALAYSRGLLEYEHAKEEVEACKQFAKALNDANWSPREVGANSIMVPLSTALLSDDVTSQQSYKTFKAMWTAGTSAFDRGEVEWMAKSLPVGSPLQKAAMSYLQDSIGGTLIAPPVQGELIELVRPREALQAAGVTRVPLPPNGRIVYPRQTGPTSMYWVGENTAITESNPTTGQVAMQAKKGGVLVRVPNELLKFSSVAADALIRSDVAKTIALGVDYAGLYGTGSAAQPKGLSLYTGTNEVIQYKDQTPAPKGIGGNGNTLRPEDGYRMIGLLEDRNFEFEGWIFRPTMANNIQGYRADAAAPADAAGAFVQSMMRAIGDRMKGDVWCGFPVTKSAVVRNTRSKGSASNLTEVFGGQWSHLLNGMYGAVEFATSREADDSFKQDQTVIRALVYTDFVPRYEGAFVHYDFLLNSVN